MIRRYVKSRIPRLSLPISTECVPAPQFITYKFTALRKFSPA
jgi:hypothetical protein